MEQIANANRNLEEIAAKGLGMESIETEEHMRQMWAGQSNVLVAVRVRPLMKHDLVKRSCVRVLDSKVVIILDPAAGDKQDILRANRNREKQYAFDYVFEPGSSQDSVYHHTTKFLIHGVLDGFNATVFAYGQTGSGKTYSMIGTPSEPGIMVRVMGDLFVHSASLGKQQGVHYKVSVSFLEVYNENIRDLLGQTGAEEYLDLREDPIKGPVVAGITEVEAKTSQEIMQLLQQGNAKRSQAATAANETSSRSHAVLQVIVESRDNAPGVVENIKVGKLSLVDLAGSERAANTKNTGVRLVEGANINRSLLALGNCINALGEKGNKGNFVPYRDSKLTRLLKDSLGGNCRTVMIANISAAENSFEETLNTLKYANRAKNIKTEAKRNVLNVNYHISEYVQLINNLRGEIKVLKEQIEGQQGEESFSPDGLRGLENAHQHPQINYSALAAPSPLRGPSTPLHALRDSLRSGGGMRAGLSSQQGETRELVNSMRQRIVSNFQERMQLRRSLIELEDQNVQNSIEVSKRQLIVVQWSEHSRHDGVEAPEPAPGADFSAHIIAHAPSDIVGAWRECEQLRKAVLKNNSVKRSIAKRLRHNEREAERFRDELGDKITGEDRRELMELQYQVGRLELENMELEQHRIVHESILKGKDLTIQKLKLQLAVRDKLISRQQAVLRENNLEEEVGYNQLALMEQLGEDVQQPPPSPPRHLSGLMATSQMFGTGSLNTSVNPGIGARNVQRGHPNPQGSPSRPAGKVLGGGSPIHSHSNVSAASHGHPIVPHLDVKGGVFSASSSSLDSSREEDKFSTTSSTAATGAGQPWEASSHGSTFNSNANANAQGMQVRGKGPSPFSRRSPREYPYDGSAPSANSNNNHGNVGATAGKLRTGPAWQNQNNGNAPHGPHGGGYASLGPKGGRVIRQQDDDDRELSALSVGVGGAGAGPRAIIAAQGGPSRPQRKPHSQSQPDIAAGVDGPNGLSIQSSSQPPGWASSDHLDTLGNREEQEPPVPTKRNMSLQALRERELAAAARAAPSAAEGLAVQGQAGAGSEALRRPLAAPGQQRQRIRQAFDGVAVVVNVPPAGGDLDEASVDSLFSEGSDRSERSNNRVKGRLLIPSNLGANPSQQSQQGQQGVGVGGGAKSAVLEKLKARAPSFGMAAPPGAVPGISNASNQSSWQPQQQQQPQQPLSQNQAALGAAAQMGFQENRVRGERAGLAMAAHGHGGQMVQTPAAGVGLSAGGAAVQNSGLGGMMRPTNRRSLGQLGGRPKPIVKPPGTDFNAGAPDMGPGLGLGRPSNADALSVGQRNRSLPNLPRERGAQPNSARRE